MKSDAPGHANMSALSAPRILMVTRETGPDRRYGLGRSLAPVVLALQREGAQVRYFCQEDLSAADLERRQAVWARLSSLPFIRGRDSRLALVRAWQERLQVGEAAGKLALAENYSYVHAHDPWIACGVWWATRGPAGRAIRWGITQHGFGSYSLATHADGLTQGPAAQRCLRRVEATVVSRADWVTAPTRAALEQLARDLCEPNVKPHWHCVPHGRPAIAAPTPAQRAAAREQLQWRDDQLVVLGVGRLAPLTCFDRLVDACAAQALPSLRLVLLGGGDPAPFMAQAQARGFAGQLQITTVDDVTLHLHGADLYASASSTESFGLANLEALCAGLPALCSAAGGVPEVVGDGAWLVPNDVASLSGALRALIGDPALRRAWAERALARAAQWPTPEQVARQYLDIYRGAAARAPR
jgi:glycosyltransferase involved in cell wall biosynthesis